MRTNNILMKQPIKTNLKSWRVCLGLLPLPEKLIKDIENGESRHEREPNFERTLLTTKQIADIEVIAMKMITAGDTAEEIYDRLIALGKLPVKDNGKYPSFAKIASIVTDLRKKMGLGRGGKETGRIGYEMKINGATESEIAAKLNLKESSIRSLVSRYKKKLERGEV